MLSMLHTDENIKHGSKINKKFPYKAGLRVLNRMIMGCDKRMVTW
jgi:hypothetical protein